MDLEVKKRRSLPQRGFVQQTDQPNSFHSLRDISAIGYLGR